MSNCQLKVNLSQTECDAVDRACVRETGRTGALVNRSDLVRIWVAAGCPTQAEAVTGLPVSKASLFAAMDALAEGQPPEEEEDGGAAPPLSGLPGGAVLLVDAEPSGMGGKNIVIPPINTPAEAAKKAKELAAKKDRPPIPKSSGDLL